MPRIIKTLETSEPTRYALLEPFFEEVDQVLVLPEAEDIRRFADLLGIKHLAGRSRRELILKLAHVTARVPLDRLSEALPRAKTISAKVRREGYSVLTDMLMRNIRAAS